MDEDKDTSIYPTADKGPLKEEYLQAPATPKKKPLLKAKDYGPITLIVGFMIIMLLIAAIIGFITYRVGKRNFYVDPQLAAMAITKELAKHNTTQDLASMQSETKEVAEDCRGKLGVTVTHNYESSSSKPTLQEYTTLEIAENTDISAFLQQVTEKTVDAVNNEYNIVCLD